MATGIPFGWQVENANGVPVSGAKVYFYQPGTTTPRSAYTDDGLTVPAANPVIADSAGWFSVYMSSDLGYDVVIKSADDSITYYEITQPSVVENAQPVDATLTMLAGLTGTDGDIIEFTGSDTGRVRKLTVATKSALQALTSPQENDVVRVLGGSSVGDGWEGNFRWVTGDQSANVTADTTGAIWVPLTGEDGSTGAFKRIYTGPIRLEWCGTTATGLAAALAFGEVVTCHTASLTFEPNTSQAASILAAIDLFEPRVACTLELPAGTIDMGTNEVRMTNPFLRNLKTTGQEVDTVTLSAISRTGGSAKAHTVEYTLSDVTDLSEGNAIAISSATGTGLVEVIQGAFEVTGLAGSVATVTHPLNATWPTLSLTSATVYILQTVIEWDAGVSGIVSEDTFLNLENVHLKGPIDASSHSPADSRDDGIQIGSARTDASTQENNRGGAFLRRVAISGFDGNGLQVKSGNVTCETNTFWTIGNGWRGQQVIGCGSLISKGSTSGGNGASNFDAENNGNAIFDDAVAWAGHDDNFYASRASLAASDAKSYLSPTVGARMLDGAFALLNGLESDGNDISVSATCAVIRMGGSASISNSGTYDLQVLETGMINCKDASSIGSTHNIDHQSGARAIDDSGDLILPTNVEIFEASGGNKGRIAAASTGQWLFQSDTGSGYSSLLRLNATSGTLDPQGDNTQKLGQASNRWSEVFAGTGTINTSDERAKADIASIPDAVLDAWADVEWCQFRYNGRNRLHIGLIAQHIRDVFERHGIDPFAYGVLCYDEWDDEYDDEGKIVTQAGNLYGVRYDEAQALEAALVRRALKRAGIALV